MWGDAGTILRGSAIAARAALAMFVRLFRNVGENQAADERDGGERYQKPTGNHFKQ